MPANDTVERVLARVRDGGEPSPSEDDDADRLMHRAEPVARAACRAAARQFSAEALEDVVQETLETVWRRLPTFQRESSFEQWVRGIGRNVASNARRRRTELLSPDGELDPAASGLDALRALTRLEREHVVTEAISTVLEGTDQDVFYHRYIHGFDRQRIAELVGLADADAVRVVLQRAQRRVKAELKRRLEGLGHGASFLVTDGRTV